MFDGYRCEATSIGEVKRVHSGRNGWSLSYKRVSLAVFSHLYLMMNSVELELLV